MKCFTITFPYSDLIKDESEGMYIAIINAADFCTRIKKIKVHTANPREHHKDHVFDGISDTLENDTNNYNKSSDPLKLIASEIINKKDKKLLECSFLYKDKYGLCNGMARLKAMQKTYKNNPELLFDKNIFVSFIDGLCLKEEKIDVIAQRSNTSAKVDYMTLLNSRGKFDLIKDKYQEKFIYARYYEGQHSDTRGVDYSKDNSINVEFLLKLLKLCSCKDDTFKYGIFSTSIITKSMLKNSRELENSIKNGINLLPDIYDIWYYSMLEIEKTLDLSNNWMSNKKTWIFPGARKNNAKTYFMHTKESIIGTIPKNIPFYLIFGLEVFITDNEWNVTKDWLFEYAVPKLWKYISDELQKIMIEHNFPNINVLCRHDNHKYHIILCTKAKSRAKDLYNDYLKGKN